MAQLRLSIISGCIIIAMWALCVGVSAICAFLYGSVGLAWGLGAGSIALFGLVAAILAWTVDRSRMGQGTL